MVSFCLHVLEDTDGPISHTESDMKHDRQPAISVERSVLSMYTLDVIWTSKYHFELLHLCKKITDRSKHCMSHFVIIINSEKEQP